MLVPMPGFQCRLPMPAPRQAPIGLRRAMRQRRKEAAGFPAASRGSTWLALEPRSLGGPGTVDGGPEFEPRAPSQGRRPRVSPARAPNKCKNESYFALRRRENENKTTFESYFLENRDTTGFGTEIRSIFGLNLPIPGQNREIRLKIYLIVGCTRSPDPGPGRDMSHCTVGKRGKGHLVTETNQNEAITVVPHTAADQWAGTVANAASKTRGRPAVQSPQHNSECGGSAWTCHREVPF